MSWACCSLNFVFSWVKRYEADIFFNFSNDLSPSWKTSLFGDTIFTKESNHEISNGSSGDEVFLNCMWNWETFINWNCVGDSISWITNHTSCPTIRVEWKDGLDSDVKTLNFKGFEHNLCHLFSVNFWVHWCFCKHDLNFRWINSQFCVEAIVPDFLH